MKVMYALSLVMAISAIACTFTESESIERNILKNYESGDSKTLFKVYHLVYNKSYPLNSEEAIKRYRIFKRNWSYIQSENKKGHGYTLGLTKFVDFTPEELKSYINEKITGVVTDLRYLCPECNNVVLKTHADALDFFK